MLRRFGIALQAIALAIPACAAAPQAGRRRAVQPSAPAAAAPGSWEFAGVLPTPHPHVLTIVPVNDQVGWAFCENGLVYRSVDGGATWQLRNSGLPGGGVTGAATDSLRAWAVVSSETLQDTVVSSTDDGGLHWSSRFTIAGCRNCGDGIRMIDSANGAVIADPIRPGAVWQLWSSTDGGMTWNHVPGAPSSRGMSEYGITNAWDFVATDHLWFATGTDDPAVAMIRVYRGADGMSGTWTFAEVPITPLPDGRRIVNAIAFVDSAHGMLASYGRDVMKTADSGVTWRPVRSPMASPAWRSLTMSGMKDGSNVVRLLVADDGNQRSRIFFTADFGATWVEEPISQNFITCIAFVNAAIGWAGTVDGRIFRFKPDELNVAAGALARSRGAEGSRAHIHTEE